MASGADYLDLELLQRLLVAFARSEDAGEALTVARIISVVGEDDPSPLRRSRILRHLLWLLKYGYLRNRPVGFSADHE